MAISGPSMVLPVSEIEHIEDSHGGGGPTDEVRSHGFDKNSGMRCTVSEIEEEISSDLFEIGPSGGSGRRDDQFESSLFSYDIHRGGEIEEEDCVYVAVGKEEPSMDALTWTLRNIQATSRATTTAVYLVHVFPETHFIPSPLGKLPVSDVGADQVESYKTQERVKRREMLQKFVSTCTAHNVKVDTILIESDLVEKAILDLIPILNVRQIVFGTPKSGLRKLRSKRGSGIAEILQKAPEFCEVKIICEGKEIVLDQTTVESPRTPRNEEGPDGTKDEQSQSKDYFPCICFKPKTS